MKVFVALRTVLLILFFSTGALAAERLAISANIANIRSGPGTKFDTTWQVEKYHPIEIIEKSGSWYHFRDFENDEGWVHQSLVGKISAVITVKDFCNVRSGPGPKYNVVFTVGKGVPFKAKGRKGNWIQIVHSDGDEGWIYKSLIW